ncbi:aminopeptidase N [Trueperella bonasi]|uniref:Aminopeptidase N n=1 Tax=Trueperella bonasi TaxID=312286 RepID=A0ABT9NE45_9ACTO|nr:aminopeptidase N [Trueperella bonasi]MDP9805470.1 aminopeptidase N [Trueperella bonasi]
MTENLKRSEARARTELLTIESYSIELDISEATLETEFFDVISAITLTARKSARTFIDFIGHEVAEVRIDDAEVPFSFDGARIHLAMPEGAHTIEVRARGRYSTTGEGLHRFRDPVDSETYLYSQFEPADARRVFPNFEQPDLKATFSISITGPARWTTLSNGRQIACEAVGSKSDEIALARRTFATTKPMSTYLVAFVAGPYCAFHDAVEIDGQTIDLGFYCRESLKAHFDLDDISTVTKQGLQLLPKVFDYPYVWGKYDSVFVPEYNLGAMENPGCVTFSEDAYIYRGKSTRAQRANRANTILHEMSHMWFGDLVTPVWWDDLWLKESFAEFLGAWTMAATTKYTEAWENFAGARVAWALRNDQYPTTHPIIAHIPDLEAAEQAFDGITYAKGAAVLRQLVAYVGEDAFFSGAAQLFKKNAFGNTTLTDLLAALEATSGKDLGEWADQWLASAGVSTVVVERQPGGVKLTQVGTDPQTGKAITRPHLLRVSGWSSDGKTLAKAGQTDVELRDSIYVPWEEIGGEGVDLVLPNDESLSYIKIDFDERSADAALAFELDDSFGQSIVTSALWEMVRDAKLPAAAFADKALRSGDHVAPHVLATRVNNAMFGLQRYVPVDERDAELTAFFEAATQARSDSESDVHLIWSRALARAGASLPHKDDVLASTLASTQDQDLRWMLLTARAGIGSIGQAELDEELAKSGTASDVVAHLQAWASLPGSTNEALEKLKGGGLSNDHVSALIAGLTQPLRVESTREAFPDYFEQLEAIWRLNSQEIAERIIYGLYPMSDFRSTETPEENADFREAEAWLTEHNSAPAALRKIVRDCQDEHLRALRAQAAAQ